MSTFYVFAIDIPPKKELLTEICRQDPTAQPCPAILPGFSTPIESTASKPNAPLVEPNKQPTPTASCELLDNGEKYPECVVTYKPPFPKLGEYSVAGVCSAFDHTDTPTVVTLGDREGLDAAYARLKVASGNKGGKLLVPWDVDTVQCDNLWIGKNKAISGPVTISGVLGPNGEMPRFYCRSDTRDGTIPKADVEGEFLHTGGAFPLLIEQIHGDGYKKGVSNLGRKRVTLRNNYLHHGLSDGIGGSNNGGGTGGLELEVCGNEIGHYGRGNTIHNFYLHRSLGGAGDKPDLDGNPSWNKATLVDNLIHSSPYSSAYKSITNENIILNNKIYGSLATDPSYERRYSSMLLDMPACSINRIEGNELHAIKPSRKSYGDIIIGIRNRKTAMRGCDIPQAWSLQGKPPSMIPGPIHTDAYFLNLKGRILFRTIIKNNLIEAGGEFGDRYYAITMWGTYPDYAERLGGPPCFLKTPAAWYERSRIYVSENRYIGLTQDHLYRNYGIHHSPSCAVQPAPTGPGPENDMIEIGPREAHIHPSSQNF